VNELNLMAQFVVDTRC